MYITGKLGHITCTTLWLRYLLLDLYMSIMHCLRLHHNHLSIINKQFRMLLKLQRDKEAPHYHHTFASACTEKVTHLLWHRHFITTTLQHDLSLITDILSNASVLRCCHVAHLTPQDPSAIAYLDSSSHTAEGFLDSLSFWSRKSRHAQQKPKPTTPSALMPWNMWHSSSTMWQPWQHSKTQGNRTRSYHSFSSQTTSPPKNRSPKGPKNLQNGGLLAAPNAIS